MSKIGKSLTAILASLVLAGCSLSNKDETPESTPTPIPAPTTKPLEKISFEVEGKDGTFLANDIEYGRIDYPGGDWTIGEYEREINVSLPKTYNQQMNAGSLVRLKVFAPGKAIIRIKDDKKITKENEIFGFGEIEYYIPQHTTN